jgi:hypothetical protein
VISTSPRTYLDHDGCEQVVSDERHYRDRDERVHALVRALLRDARYRGKASR